MHGLFLDFFLKGLWKTPQGHRSCLAEGQLQWVRLSFASRSLLFYLRAIQVVSQSLVLAPYACVSPVSQQENNTCSVLFLTCQNVPQLEGTFMSHVRSFIQWYSVYAECIGLFDKCKTSLKCCVFFFQIELKIGLTLSYLRNEAISNMPAVKEKGEKIILQITIT